MVIPFTIVLIHGTKGMACLGVIRYIFKDRVALLLDWPANGQAATVLWCAVLGMKVLIGEARRA